MNYRENQDCWGTIQSLKDMIDHEHRILDGDFNFVLSQSEKKGGDCSRDPLKEMVENIILDQELYDIKPKKG